MEILIEFGTESQKKQYLMPLLAGKIRSCFSMTESDHPGSNPTIMGTVATMEGTEYVINGHKWFTSAADGAAFAIVMVSLIPMELIVIVWPVKSLFPPIILVLI